MDQCKKVRELIPLYCFDELSPGDASIVQEHVAACTTCRRELESTRDILALANEKAVPEMPDQFWADYCNELNNKIGKETVVKTSLIESISSKWNHLLSALGRLVSINHFRRLGYVAVVVMCAASYIVITRQPTTVSPTDQNPVAVVKKSIENPPVKTEAPDLQNSDLSLEEELLIQELVLLSELGEDIGTLINDQNIDRQVEMINRLSET